MKIWNHTWIDEQCPEYIVVEHEPCFIKKTSDNRAMMSDGQYLLFEINHQKQKMRFYKMHFDHSRPVLNFQGIVWEDEEFDYHFGVPMLVDRMTYSEKEILAWCDNLYLENGRN